MHGGGFLSGDRDTHDPICRRLANRVPVVVVAVEYKLAPEYPFPAGLEDCADVLRWLSTEASAIGGDPLRLVLVGDSAGGNLAAALTSIARDEMSISPLAQVLIYPMLDATMSSPSLVENAFVPPFTLIDCVYAWQLYLGPEANRHAAHISPILARNLNGLPPALIVTAGFDILTGEGQAYAERLKDAGVPVRQLHYPGMVHGFFQWAGVLGEAREAMDCVVEYLQEISALR